MADPTIAVAPPAADGPLHVRPDRPIDIHFSFEERQSRVGAGASMGAHVVMVILAILVIQYRPAPKPYEPEPELKVDRLVFLPIEGPGGGGGGGGNKRPEPPRPAEVPGKEKITVPVEKKPTPAPPKVEEPEPLPAMNLPVVNMAAAEQQLPGAILSEAPAPPDSQGSGSGGGAGTGAGSGSGSGSGSGLGPGSGGGTGGGVYRPGAGITLPRVLREVKPQYTADAMRAKVQGSVWLECIVMPDGSVGDVKVTKSLDPIFGLDQEAIKAARMWRFSPGLKQGQAVPVMITIELTFTLR